MNVDKKLGAFASAALLAWILWVGGLVSSLLAQNTVTVNPSITGGGGQAVTVGSGGASAAVCGLVPGATLISATQTDANTTEKDLWTYTVPAGTLTDGRGFRVTIEGSVAANANVKTIRFYIGSTNSTIVSGSPNNIAYRSDVTILRITDTTQKTTAVTFSSAATFTYLTNSTTPGSWSSPVVLKVTGQNGTASAGDIVLRTLFLECL